jgi:5-methylthioadenosine/S-adenosylhomocysteine deaminase
VPVHDVVSNIVYSAQGGDVVTTIVNGKILMEDRKVKTLNEKEVLEKASKAAGELIG